MLLLRPLRELKEILEERHTPIERLARGFSSPMWIEFIRKDIEDRMRADRPQAVEHQSSSSSRSGNSATS
jgi:hypothetical protein